ncbi:hypothetical protein J6590_038325 [Homalodisca vitripennis]|nr:hypothetical protein J6590_038325 [Homalodisca vitripennis]
MLKDEEGYVFKPINKPELGRREVLFYETVMTSELEVIKELKQFVPEYLGTVELAVNGITVRTILETSVVDNIAELTEDSTEKDYVTIILGGSNDICADISQPRLGIYVLVSIILNTNVIIPSAL